MRVISAKDWVIVFEALFIAVLIYYIYGLANPRVYSEKPQEKFPEPAATTSFMYSFNVPGVLEEASEIGASASKYWWVNSGGLMRIGGGIGMTNQGDLSQWSRWRIIYNLNNPTDTDGGLHPQNIFRLISRSSWRNFREQIYFKINKDNLSQSPNRNISNGVFLISRYKDGSNLYYVGVRVDGTAIIKKKVHGEYIVLAQTQIWNGEAYDRELNPSLLPKGVWLGLRSEIGDTPSGDVSIKLHLDKNGNGIWRQVLQAVDKEKETGGSAITEPGRAGLRSDFMDIEFKNFEITEL